jgi:hypothetical protein
MAEIRLARGQVSIVDDGLVAKLSPYQWYLSNKGYVVARAGGRKLILMHRVIAAPGEQQVVDHRNGDKLDNRLSNLRACSRAENARNRKMHENNRCGTKGVYADITKKVTRYRAQIRVDGKKISLGSFPSLIDAEHAYKVASAKYHGNFGRA